MSIKPRSVPAFSRFIWQFIFVVIILGGHINTCWADSKLEAQIRNDIKTSQKSLNLQQASYTKQLSAINKRLQAQTLEVEAMRKKIAAATRSTDESSLSIDALRSRVKKWNDQHSYQQHLLLSFFNQYPGLLARDTKLDEQQLSDRLTLIQKAFTRINAALYPNWQSLEIIDTHGTVTRAQTLNLGPSFWYVKDQSGGLLKQDARGKLGSAIEFPASPLRQLQELQATGQGELLLDPTLNKVQQYMAEQDGLISHVEKGGIWVIPIFAFAFLSLLIALIKTVQLWRLPKIIPMVPERMANALSRRRDENSANEANNELLSLYTSVSGAQRELLRISMETPSPAERDDLLVSCLLENKHSLEKYLGVIAITAAVAPLLGLLGTVSGMIETFKMMTIFGTGDPAVVSGGISEALVTTELGLVVAIPALVINAILLRKIKGYAHLLETTAIKLSKLDIPVTPKTLRESANDGKAKRA